MGIDYWPCTLCYVRLPCFFPPKSQIFVLWFSIIFFINCFFIRTLRPLLSFRSQSHSKTAHMSHEQTVLKDFYPFWGRGGKEFWRKDNETKLQNCTTNLCCGNLVTETILEIRYSVLTTKLLLNEMRSQNCQILQIL